jgi:hypothetical protein
MPEKAGARAALIWARAARRAAAASRRACLAAAVCRPVFKAF